MIRGLVFASICLMLSSTASVQELGVLRITVALPGTEPAATPIRRHLLLISDNPASAPPRRVFSSQDGTVEVRLSPGNYTVESDQPVVFEGKGYSWTQTVDVVAGRDTVLTLTADNADAVSAPITTGATSALDEDGTSLSVRWQDSVVAVWTPTAHASGFVVDSAGLVATNHDAIGLATTVEVQFSPSLKVTGVVVATDPERDVAVVRIDPATAAAVKPVPLACGEPGAAPAIDDEVFAIEAPLRQPKGATSGTVRRVAPRVIESDLSPGVGGSGGPVFSTRGALLGLTSEGDKRAREHGADPRIVRASEVCAVVELARTKLAVGAPPPATPLPVEPTKPYASKVLEEIARPTRNLNPYQASSSDFDVAFLTPVHVFAGRARPLTSSPTSRVGAGYQVSRLTTDFSNWSEYAAEVPPVLMIRVTPKLVESFWMKVARGAAMTKGIALPPIKRLKSGFARLRAYCGDRELTPIHPFLLELEASETETLAEGLYVFAPDALSPACGGVRLELYSQQAPAKADPLVVESAIIEQIWGDFAAYRAQP